MLCFARKISYNCSFQQDSVIHPGIDYQRSEQKRRPRTIPLFMTSPKQTKCISSYRRENNPDCREALQLYLYDAIAPVPTENVEDDDVLDSFIESRSSLLHSLGTSDLHLNLSTSPASGIDGSLREFSVGACLLDHGHQPIGAVESGELSVREALCKVTGNCQQLPQKSRRFSDTYPMTPIDDRRSPSVLFWSINTMLRS